MGHKRQYYISIRKRIIVLVLAVFTGILLLMLVQDSYRQKIDSEKDKLITLSNLFNDISLETDNCGNLIYKLVNGKLAQQKNFDYEQYGFIQEKMQYASEQLADMMNMENYNRSTIDLKYMISTYLQYASDTITAAKTDRYDEINSIYKKSEQTREFIREQLNVVYRDIQQNHRVSMEELEKYRRYIIYINVFTTISVGVFAWILFWILDRMITRPINILSEQMKGFSLTDGKPEATITFKEPENEIDYLNNTLSEMQERICNQYNITVENAELEKKLRAEKLRVIENEKRVKEAKFKSLQARINPHFLFNSINLISKMAYMEQARQTSEMMEALGEYLRYNLDHFDKIVTLEKEIENIGDYIAIQKIRFGNRISFSVDSDERIRDARIPCLVLQPLIENSIIHGVGMYTKDGIVQVRVGLEEENRVMVSVFDNGLGMEPEKLREIRNRAARLEPGEEDGSIGLSNVFGRLRLFFNNEVIIQVDSQQGRFTKIGICFPILKSREGEDSDVPHADRG